MGKIESLVEAYLIAERDLVAVVDSAGGALPLPDGRTVTVGRAEFPALGQGLTPSPTACRAQADTGVRAQSARKGARGDTSRPCVA